MAERVDGLLRDKSRPPGIAPLDPELVDQVATLTLETPRLEASHWTVRAMANAVGIAASSVVKIWHEHGLAPYRWRSFKLSNDKAFAEKLHDVVGLYVCPPAHALVLSVDKKSQIQALGRTQPGLPLKKGRGGTMTQGRVWHRTNPCQNYLLKRSDRERTHGGAVRSTSRIAPRHLFFHLEGRCHGDDVNWSERSRDHTGCQLEGKHRSWCVRLGSLNGSIGAT